MMKNVRSGRTISALTLLLAMGSSNAAPTDTAFTFQGQLRQGGLPLDGTADFEFTLWDAQAGGAQVGPTTTVSALEVTNGLFSIKLDFGAGVFTGEARVAYSTPEGQEYGIWAKGATSGGYFHDTNDGGTAYVGAGSLGIDGRGSVAGGRFEDTDDGTYVFAAFGLESIWGTGRKAFVQNHPYDKDRVIVYTALEGDEAATYTRGTARLVGGEARVLLGDTFKWVTNPDIGLTAHLTPRRQAVPLAVVSLTTKELIVRGPDDGPDNVVFDYLVYGLRIGFEEASVVQEKEREAYIPSMASHRRRYEKHPELRRYNAMERFRNMDRAIRNTDPVDLSAARALRDAVVEFDPAVHKLSRPVSAGDSEHLRAVGRGDRKDEIMDGGNTADPLRKAAEALAPASMDSVENDFDDGQALVTAQREEISRLRDRVERIEAMLVELTDAGDGGDK